MSGRDSTCRVERFYLPALDPKQAYDRAILPIE